MNVERKMNKQIRVLAEEIGYGKDRWTSTEQFETFLQRFAELIVRECMSLTENHKNYWTQKSGSESIAEHFGVEE